ncbi:MAG: hypothetical protein M3263_04265 [Thermoproteota archaeon]|nr:hypothetical protein [Thermoproteota archaeon]
MKEIIVITIILILLASSFQMVDGHKPLKVTGSNNDFLTATEIPNHKISWGIYEEISGSNNIHYYKFAANEGERLYAQISIPKLERFSTFVPSIGLVGSNVSAGKPEAGYSVRE